MLYSSLYKASIQQLHAHICSIPLKPVCGPCRIVLVAVGSLVGGVALRPTTPLAATVIATAVIVGMALLVDAAYTRGWVPASLVHPRPLLVYADGETCCGGHTDAATPQLVCCLLARAQRTTSACLKSLPLLVALSLAVQGKHAHTRQGAVTDVWWQQLVV